MRDEAGLTIEGNLLAWWLVRNLELRNSVWTDRLGCSLR